MRIGDQITSGRFAVYVNPVDIRNNFERLREAIDSVNTSVITQAANMKSVNKPNSDTPDQPSDYGLMVEATTMPINKFNISQYESTQVQANLDSSILPAKPTSPLSSRSTERMKRPMRGRAIAMHKKIVESKSRSKYATPVSPISSGKNANVSDLHDLCSSRVLEPRSPHFRDGTSLKKEEASCQTKRQHVELSLSSDLYSHHKQMLKSEFLAREANAQRFFDDTDMVPQTAEIINRDIVTQESPTIIGEDQYIL